MPAPNQKLLTRDEAKRLKSYCQANGGQEVVAVGWNTSSSRISRIIHRKHGPQKDFRIKLVDAGIIKPHP